MFENRSLGHIGLATDDLEKTVEFYRKVLGFVQAGRFVTPDGVTAVFLQNKDTLYEIYQPKEPLEKGAEGKIDHICFSSEDIERDYEYCREQGYRIITDGIMDIPTFWENGIRYFKLESPTGEQIEFCQVG